MKKSLKITLIVLASVILLVLASPLWLGTASSIVAECVVPNLTGTDFDIDDLSINPYSGHVAAENIVLKNPKGFKDADAVRVGSLDIKLSMSSLTTDKIIIESVIVKDIFVSYVSSNGTNNFDYISSYSSSDDSVSTTSEDDESKETSAKDSKKVVIDLVKLDGIKVKLGALPLPVPSLELKDIGKESDGVILTDVFVTILDAIINSCGAITDGAILLGEGLSNVGIDAFKNTANVSGSALKGSTEAVKDVGEAVKDAGKLFKGLFK